MPELKPCPAWACQGELVESKQDGDSFYIECTECGMRGPVEPDPYHAQQSWNWLPRALTWTHEPPKVAGWYWWRTSKGQNVNTIQIWSRSGVLGYCFDTEFITDLNRGEWAGPIAPPIEP